jgi:hypothetical protein
MDEKTKPKVCEGCESDKIDDVYEVRPGKFRDEPCGDPAVKLDWRQFADCIRSSKLATEKKIALYALYSARSRRDPIPDY